MSATPRTDAEIMDGYDSDGDCPVPVVPVDFARDLERELTAAQSALAEAQKKAATLDSRRVVGWVRGVEFIGLPEHVKPGDRPIFTLEGL